MPDGNTEYNRFIHMNINQISFFSSYLVTVVQPLTLEQCTCLPGYFETILIINLTGLLGTYCEVLPNTLDIYYSNTALQSPYRLRD